MWYIYISGKKVLGSFIALIAPTFLGAKKLLGILLLRSMEQEGGFEAGVAVEAVWVRSGRMRRGKAQKRRGTFEEQVRWVEERSVLTWLSGLSEPANPGGGLWGRRSRRWWVLRGGVAMKGFARGG